MTAMQELIEELKAKAALIPTNNNLNRHIKGIYVDAICLAKYKLEKERQQIIDAGNKCQIVSDVMADGEIRFLYKDGENYYNSLNKQP